MATNNPNNSINHIPFLSEEMEWTLRRLAWRDEIFREALIADPKAVIHYLFHQSLPAGKLPDDLTIKVIEEDASTHHIVLPPPPDEEPTLEIAEEEQLDLIVNLGSLDRKRPRDSSEQPNEAESEKKKTFGDTQFKLKRGQAKEAEKLQEQTKEIKVPTETELAKALLDACRQDKEIAQAVQQAGETGGRLNDVIQMMQKKRYLSGFEIPKDVKFKLDQDNEKMYHIILSSSRDESGPPELDHNAIANKVGLEWTNPHCNLSHNICGNSIGPCSDDCNHN